MTDCAGVRLRVTGAGAHGIEFEAVLGRGASGANVSFHVQGFPRASPQLPISPEIGGPGKTTWPREAWASLDCAGHTQVEREAWAKGRWCVWGARPDSSMAAGSLAELCPHLPLLRYGVLSISEGSCAPCPSSRKPDATRVTPAAPTLPRRSQLPFPPLQVAELLRTARSERQPAAD